ncbi:MAG: hypothetical protein EHM73_10195 [Chroococcales cyanobacterium metabat2.561]|nr:MAG: hypothetical protein EHM73_10195 [Chroococcales cyanobacterium metabat2.561]
MSSFNESRGQKAKGKSFIEMCNYTKSVEYRLHIRRGNRQWAKGAIDNQFLITRFSLTHQLTIFKSFDRRWQSIVNSLLANFI